MPTELDYRDNGRNEAEVVRRVGPVRVSVLACRESIKIINRELDRNKIQDRPDGEST